MDNDCSEFRGKAVELRMTGMKWITKRYASFCLDINHTTIQYLTGTREEKWISRASNATERRTRFVKSATRQ